MWSSYYTRVLHTEEMVNHFNMKYTQHESIYREDVKLPLHISNTNQNITIPTEKYINLGWRYTSKYHDTNLWYQLKINKTFWRYQSKVNKNFKILKDTNVKISWYQFIKNLVNFDTNRKWHIVYIWYQLKDIYRGNLDTNWK